MDMIDYLTGLMANHNTKLYLMLVVVIIANCIDFALGVLNAQFNASIAFSTQKAIHGLTRKVGVFCLLVIFLPLALMALPFEIAVTSYFVLCMGYIFFECKSIMAHLGLTDDENKTGELFIDFLKKMMEGGKK